MKTSNGDPLNKTELFFTNINRTEAGEYKCVASNPCSTSTELAEVDVLCKLTETMLHFFLTGKWRLILLAWQLGCRALDLESRGSRAIHRQELVFLVLCNPPHSFLSVTYWKTLVPHVQFTGLIPPALCTFNLGREAGVVVISPLLCRNARTFQ